MSVLPNDRYEKIIAAAGQTVFNYDWDVPSAYPGQVKVIQYVLATHTKTTLTYGVDYTVDVANKRVTLTNATAAGDTIVLYSGTPEARETDFTGSTVNVAAANEAIDNLTWQTQQLARDVKRCVRVDMVEGIMAGELPSVDDRRNKYASWDDQGNLTYDDPVTGILNDYMRKDQNLSDVANVATARTNLGLGDAATRNVGTTAGTVCAGDDARFLTQAQKDALTNGGNADAMHIHSGYVAVTEKGAPNGVATLDANSKLPNAQLPSNAVVSTTTSSDSEIALFNGVSGTQIKRSNTLLPAGDVVGTTDVQTLTNKTIDADNNTVTNLEVDNLKAGVLNTDLTGAVSNTQVPSAQATKTYADTKMGALVNLGAGAQVGNRLNGGSLELRTLVAKDGIYLVQNENDIYIYATNEKLFPKFKKQGNGADWLIDVQIRDVNYRSFTGSNGITITENADEIDTSLTNITAQGDMIVGDAGGEAITLAKGADDQVLRMAGDDPKWETLGTMADQNSDLVNITGGTIDSVAITGGTVSGLTAPMAIADGGTGQTTKQAAFDGLSPLTTQGDILTHDGTNNVRLALGNAGECLKVNAGGTDVEWGEGYVTPTTTQGDIIVRGAAADERLGIGTAGQVLKVNAAGTDPEWGTGYETPTTTQGDLIIRGAAADTRLGIGVAGQVLKVNAGGNSPEWASAENPTLTTQGDLLTRDGAGEVRLPIGTAGQVLKVNAGGTDPEWATLGSMSTQASNNVNITGGTIDSVAITGGTVSGLTSPLALADGGTGQTTKQAAFDGLSPLTTQGDILTHDGTNNVRLARGTAGKYLRVNAGGTDVEWGDGYVSPTTTQGDIIVRGAAADERLGIGTAGQVLKVNGTGDGLVWANDAGTALTTRGDLLTRDATDEVRLPIGTPGQVLQVNAGGTDPEWATLGSMSTQDSTNVNITGGTISGLTTPLAVASGGTGVNAFGTAGQLLTVNKTADALAWHTFDCLDISSLGISKADGTDFNTITTPGTYMMNEPQNSANKPPSITANSVRITVKQINSNNILQTVETAVSNQHFVRVYRISADTWSDWNPQTNVAFCIGLSSGTLTGTADSSYHKVALDTLFFNTAGGTFASNGYKLPYTGNWLFILKCNWWSNVVSTKYCEVAKGSSLTQLEFGCHYFATTSQDNTTTTVTALASCNKNDEIYMAANNMTTSGGLRIIEGTRLQGIYLGV